MAERSQEKSKKGTKSWIPSDLKGPKTGSDLLLIDPRARSATCAQTCPRRGLLDKYHTCASPFAKSRGHKRTRQRGDLDGNNRKAENRPAAATSAWSGCICGGTCARGEASAATTGGWNQHRVRRRSENTSKSQLDGGGRRLMENTSRVPKQMALSLACRVTAFPFHQPVCGPSAL